jgi:hypothetical protein
VRDDQQTARDRDEIFSQGHGEVGQMRVARAWRMLVTAKRSDEGADDDDDCRSYLTRFSAPTSEMILVSTS